MEGPLKEYFEERVSEVGYPQCEICYRSNGVWDVHHIVYRSEKPKHKEINNKRNLVLVCRQCHDRLHCKAGDHKKEIRRELVEDRNLIELFGKDIL